MTTKFFNQGLIILSAAFLISACDSSKSGSTSENANNSIAGGGGKIAYVNSDSLLNNFEMIKDLEEELIQEKLTLQNQFQAEYAKLEKDYMDAQKGADQLSPEAVAILQRRLGQREQELMQTQQQMENQLMGSENIKNEQYLKVIREYIDKYGSENGYQIIYSYNGMGNVLYIDPAYDITNQVVDALNNEYASKSETVEAN